MNGFDRLVWREWRRSRTMFFVALGIIVALLLLVFGQPQTPPEAAGGEIRVVGSMAVVGYFASWIADTPQSTVTTVWIPSPRSASSASRFNP